MKRNFASDNNSGIHPKVLEAITEVNRGHAVAYGEDPVTAAATAKFHEHFGPDVEVFFVFNGTAANVLSLQAATRSYQSIICAEEAHIQSDECGAPEKFLGSKLVSVPAPDGKIRPADVAACFARVGEVHRTQPRAVSIAQSTEYGTVYTVSEVRALAELAHARGAILHMDGARIANAAASLGVSLRTITRDAGVDILSFGGTKNGIMGGEAVVIFNPALARDFKYLRKQGMQLASKMRFISAQFLALLSDDLWLANARASNHMAKRLAEAIRGIPGVTITREVSANAVFAILPPAVITRLQREYFFHVWDPANSEARLMASFDTTEGDVLGFAELLQNYVKAY